MIVYDSKSSKLLIYHLDKGKINTSLYTRNKMSECHFCRQYLNIFKAKCCKSRCGKIYCLECIQKIFDKEFQQSLYRKETWICYSCQELCQCRICKGLGFDKKSRRKKNQDSNNNGNPPQEQNRIQINPIESIFKEEEISKLAPFMRKVILRKKILYDEILKQQEERPIFKSKSQINQTTVKQNKSIERPKQNSTKPEAVEPKEVKENNMKELINNTRKYLEDQSDFDNIQLID